MLAIGSDQDIDAAVETLKFLSDRNRLRILTTLARAETCVCDLIDELDLPQPLASYHLRKLRDAGLVRARRDAQWIYYSLDPEAWRRLIDPVVGVVGGVPLPSTAAYGTSRRCDSMPPDPAHGACDDSGGDCC
jgi:ArsR family transcriptional regulator